ncbi:MAG: type II and III secretion system protein family protein [Alphaproteobacteria bacterium]|nr:type II and III secretion system protein family protein [Alphaproteobacteria bacterium]
MVVETKRTRPGWSNLSFALATGLALCLAGPVPSAQAQTERVEKLSASDQVDIEVGKGQVIRLPRPASTVFVADPEIADVQAQSPSIIYLFGRRAGSTSMFAVDENDSVLLRSSVKVDHNLAGLRGAIDRLLPDHAVNVSSVDGSIVLDGKVESPTEAQELRELASRYLGEDETLLNRTRVGAPTQVHLRVRVAEVSREVIKEFGFNWETLFNSGNFTFGFASGRDLINTGGAIFRSPANAGGNAPGIGFGSYNTGSASVSSAIDALAEEGLVTVLAEPNLTALSGETASFLAGGEFPIPVASDDDEVQIEFKEFGISLAFTPTVLSRNRISLRVRPEVSELSDNGAITINGLTIPALATRRAETTVELGSGQSFAVGGLLSNDVQNTVSKFPGLGDLPVLGTLFRSQRFQTNETELVILVTPYLVSPVSEPVLATPADGYEPPNDIERILEGRLHHARLRPGRGAPQGPNKQRLVGPIGFVLD